jgi:tripartite ATP-independent transporter DctP family solute receptor
MTAADASARSRRMFNSSRVLASVFAAAFCVGAANAREFQSSDVEAPDHPAVKSVFYMGELMRERSGGRLRIGNLGAADQDSEIFTVAQLRTGTLDMARVSVTALHGSVPATVIPTLPFLFASVPHRRRILDGPVGAELLASLEAYDLVGLCFYDAGSRSIYMPAKAVRTPADMKGLRIRVQTSPVMAEVMQALGAIPVPIPYAQVRARLAAGTIDAAENNVISYLGSRHHEVARVYSLTEHVAPPAVVVFSKRVWDRLTSADREIIRQAAVESVPYFRKLVDEQDAAARRSLADEGVQFVTDVDKPAFVRILAPLYPKLVIAPSQRALVERIQASE